jgi:hypothetical protein
MGLKIEYASRRQEIWAWYCRAWRERLWKFHLMVFLAVSVTVGLYFKGSGMLWPAFIMLGLAFGVLAILWLPIYPLLMFKSQNRTLEIDDSGISTTIGRRSARRSWDDVLSVSEGDKSIVILGRNGNAFIVPSRAFGSIEERQRFLSYAQNAVGANPKRIR